VRRAFKREPALARVMRKSKAQAGSVTGGGLDTTAADAPGLEALPVSLRGAEVFAGVAFTADRHDEEGLASADVAFAPTPSTTPGSNSASNLTRPEPDVPPWPTISASRHHTTAGSAGTTASPSTSSTHPQRLRTNLGGSWPTQTFKQTESKGASAGEGAGQPLTRYATSSLDRHRRPALITQPARADTPALGRAPETRS
jgi:hypothetical protein